MGRHLVFACLDGLGRGIDHQCDAKELGMRDHALLVQDLGHRRRACTARDHHVLGLAERSFGYQHLMAKEERTTHQGDEQRHEEEDPAEKAEHASASRSQTGPKINAALVPPKPKELLSA